MDNNTGGLSLHKGLIFDLDGVLVNTAKYHYLAWKKLAEELGITFTETDNERLKGVSRMKSLEIILEIGGQDLPEEEKEELCDRKNQYYLDYINQLNPEETFPGAKEFLIDARERGCRIALGSVSKNSRLVLERLELVDLFDVIVDGNSVTRSKPDPEVFVLAGQWLKETPDDCLVFEDAVAGVQAAHAADMIAVGIGTREKLPEADIVIPGFDGITILDIEKMLS